MTERKSLLRRLARSVSWPAACSFKARSRFGRGDKPEALEDFREAIAISRETGIQYAGPTILADIAFTTNDEEERHRSLNEGEALLASGSLSHNYFEFYGLAIDTSLKARDWDEAERYATALEDYTRQEPLVLSDLLIARGRALAAVGRGRRDDEIIAGIRSLRDQAAQIGFATALPALDDALKSA